MDQKSGHRSRSHALLCAAILVIMATGCAGQRAETKAQTSTDAASVKVPAETKGAIFSAVPDKIDRGARYLFYLHGRVVEEKGIRPTDPRFGVYEYEEILKTFADKGFVVLSEARAKGTDVKEYARKIVRQIDSLIKAGVPASHITVVGASKGSMITMLVSTQIKNRDLNYVIMSNCNDWVLKNYDIDLHGNVLSIYDVNDGFGGTCKKFFARGGELNRSKEVMLTIGTGHAILYQPLKEWVEPVVEWAGQP